MNDHDSDHDHDDLAARLRQLPAERLPPAAAWQRIAAQLHEAPRERHVAAAPPPRRRRWPRIAAAAAVAALAVSGAGRWWGLHERPPQPAAQAPASPLEAQADALAHAYGQAIAAIPQDNVPAELLPALRELDASAGSIRSAIAQSPDAGFLLGQLRRTYALRLELTRQGLEAAGLPT
ncbi:hypothetical protein CQ393_17350 [Stenotrophomonas sp. MYb238]|uniref:hypothetical protein n=1 Tax=Stenotrophomonas sp. MYb238 TaxID=2040281 RepID=UPI00129240B9|nr:hypothetical protein [Stenotrophomonas sp. MYb238]MQP77650.1 hypothetical protein [Stenotrophomonas sp. MYb238]